ncbi:MAG: hypothetical protein H7256_10660 [Bdellovibrio sp.]|nr:hypothetical protein [Bdellovibrio sp.]
MKFLILTVVSFLSSNSAMSAETNCVLEETLHGEISAQSLALPESTDPHGAISNFTLIKHPDYEGFVALSNGFTVINLVNSTTGIGTSTQSKSATDNFVRLQLVVGVNDGSIDTIVIQCGEPTK